MIPIISKKFVVINANESFLESVQFFWKFFYLFYLKTIFPFIYKFSIHWKDNLKSIAEKIFSSKFDLYLL